MAVIRVVQSGNARKSQAIVRKGGYALTRTFWKHAAAVDWSRRVEDAIASATPAAPFCRTEWLTDTPEPVAVDDTKPHAGWTLHRLLTHYAENVSPAHKGHEQESKRLRTWQAHRLSNKLATAVSTSDLQTHVQERLALGRAGSTVRLEMMLLRAVYRESGLGNPVIAVKLPPAAAHRQRRLEDGAQDGDGEEARLRAAIALDSRGADLLDLLDLSLETGMRQSEILSLTAGQLKRVRGAQYIEQLDSKNGQPRRVTLSSRAVAVFVRRATGLEPQGRLFNITANRLWKRWDDLRRAAGVTGFRWHDLRHEALSRMASRGLTIGELQAQSGHRSPAILIRYINAKPADVSKKLG